MQLFNSLVIRQRLDDLLTKCADLLCTASTGREITVLSGRVVHEGRSIRELRRGGWPAPGLDDTDLSESGPALELHGA